jgi:hypothetical protein
MKIKFFFLLSLALAVLVCSVAAAPQNTVLEPEYIGLIHYLNASGSLLSLDRQTPRSKAGFKALGLNGAKITIELDGEKASVRIPQNQAMSFVVQLPSGVDPRRIQLYSFTVKGNKRQLAITSDSIGKDGRAVTSIKMNISRYGQNSYKLAPVGSLSVGEYGFMGDDTDVFSFGVEAGNGDGR